MFVSNYEGVGGRRALLKIVLRIPVRRPLDLILDRLTCRPRVGLSAGDGGGGRETSPPNWKRANHFSSSITGSDSESSWREWTGINWPITAITLSSDGGVGLHEFGALSPSRGIREIFSFNIFVEEHL
ncbi:hypothetical protein CDAR_315351 [Caerostris darwini]|uniref:Uncharacterized protein n=1 Tax=Caerostris darwini TaxID=1538125 RepID=A0AAV4VE85_9ARAC|nr:hypothetical protein CDAR_315351 [Caerostris darwini]